VDFAGFSARGTPIQIEKHSKEEEMKHAPEGKEQVLHADDRFPYEPPAIIYKGKISTRAGSPFPRPEESTTVVDPADLFGDD